MNLKPRSDSLIDSLPPEQRKQIDDWLFKDNLGYRDAVRLAKGLGLTIPYNTFVRYYQRQATTRLMDTIAASAEKARELADKFKDPKFCEALSVVTGQLAFEEALETLSNPADLLDSSQDSESKPENKSGRAPRRRAGKYDALIDAASLFYNGEKMNLAKRGGALDHKKFDLDYQKYRDHVAEQKAAVQAALAKSRQKPGLSDETIAQIQAAINLI